jgi:PAS domain S-box-containing protein
MNNEQKSSVLIIDDNIDNLKVLFISLEKANFKVLIAEKGESALKRIKYLKPDIILLDVIMPDMNGFEVCRRLKANEESKNIPVIFMTALTDTVDKLKGFEVGGVDYIIKPVQVEEVLVRINTHLTIQRLQNQLLQQNEQLKQEIVKRQHVEDELRKFYRAVEQTANAIVITDINGSIEFVNPAFSFQTGYSPAEVIGKNPRILSSGKQSRDFYQKMWYTLNSGAVWKDEILNKRQNGELYWALQTISPIKDQDGKTTHYLAIQENITKRKQVAEQLRKFSSAIEQSANIIVITDADGTIEFVNPAFSIKTGYSYAEAIGQTPSFLKSGKQKTEFYKNLWFTISHGKVWQGEMHNKHKNGELYWEFITISPIKNALGKTTNYVAIKEDITERKRIEETLRQNEERMRRYFEQPLIGMATCSLSKEILEVNDKFCEMLGYTREELVPHQNLANLSHPVDLASSAELFNCVIAGERDSFLQDKRYNGRSSPLNKPKWKPKPPTTQKLPFLPT